VNNTAKTQSKRVYEIDLHIEKLVTAEEESQMSAGQKLDYQIRTFQRHFNIARQRQEKKMIVIHGKGAGVLRAEIREVLYRQHLDLEVNDINGGGASEIIFY